MSPKHFVAGSNPVFPAKPRVAQRQRHMKYTRECLEPVVSRCTSMGQVLRELGLKPAGGNYSHIKQTIQRFQISTNHFVSTTTGSKSNFGGGTKRRSLKVIFSIKPIYGPYEKGQSLRKALIDTGREYVCQVCGQRPWWNDRPLTLQVDHINGCRWDDREENLRFLCPHCHTQTDTHSGKKKFRDVVEW